MSVKAFITDLDGTLFADAYSLVAGYDKALTQLQQLGLKIVIFSNLSHRIVDRRMKLLPITPDLVLTREDVGIPKGSPLWINKVCTDLKLDKNEVVYIGDRDHDMQTAVNSKIIYLNAEWSNPGYKYGIPVSSPGILPAILKHFFLKKHLWYWNVDTSDLRGNPVISRALIQDRDIGVNNFRDNLLRWSKQGIDSQVGSVTMSEFMIYLLLGSLYLDGMYSEIDTVAIIPGHAGGHNPLMGKNLHRMARLFRDTFLPNLLHRHTIARKSAYVRYAGESPTFRDQVLTMCLDCDPKDRGKMIEGKIILVTDDFVTQGFSTEWARNLLYNAGAKEVISVTIGAFHDAIEVQSIAKEFRWDSFNPVDIDDKYIVSKEVLAIKNPKALETIVDSYKELIGTQP